MAKRSKAKAKRAKTARTKKARSAGKTKKSKTSKKLSKKNRTGASGTDPCAPQQRAVDDAQLVVDDLTNEIDDPGIPPMERLKAQKKLHAATMRLTAAQRALDQCRRQHS